jgi:uridine phosphorylase
MTHISRDLPPILRDKHHDAPSAFTPESLLREARRQKNVSHAPVPEVCILDPDGDIVRHLRATGLARRTPGWACYHSEMDSFELGGREYGIVGCAVGAPYAVLLAEQMFASGTRLLISITSSGQITALRPPPYFILIDRALRDEGTSYHYLPASSYAEADPALIAAVAEALSRVGEPVERGATWTTDAPYRETAEAIEAARVQRILAVEMEAAALYAFARARGKPVLCFAHVTNQMGQSGDFEKGEANGATASLALAQAVAEAWAQQQSHRVEEDL